jgi:hypothetical protein
MEIIRIGWKEASIFGKGKSFLEKRIKTNMLYKGNWVKT